MAMHNTHIFKREQSQSGNVFNTAWKKQKHSKNQIYAQWSICAYLYMYIVP